MYHAFPETPKPINLVLPVDDILAMFHFQRGPARRVYARFVTDGIGADRRVVGHPPCKKNPSRLRPIFPIPIEQSSDRRSGNRGDAGDGRAEGPSPGRHRPQGIKRTSSNAARHSSPSRSISRSSVARSSALKHASRRCSKARAAGTTRSWMAWPVEGALGSGLVSCIKLC